MNDGKEAGPAATPEPPRTENFQDRLNAALEKWRNEGCPRPGDDDPKTVICGSRPHLTKMDPKDADGNIVMHINCAAGHEDVWQFKIPAVEMQAELARQQAAAAEAERNGGKAKDPMKASVKITMDLKTQEVTIDPWVPTPGMGIQLAGILMSHFFAQMQANAAPANRLKLPPQGLVHPKTGRPIVQ